MNDARKPSGPIGFLIRYVRTNPTWAMPFVIVGAFLLAAAWMMLLSTRQ